MKTKSFIPMLSLQVFAEGAGDGGTAQGQGVTAEAASQQTGVNNSLADVKYGVQENVAPAAEVQETNVVQTTPEEEFESLIKGKYKAQYDARMQNTIQKRLKGTQETVDKYNALRPVLETLAKKHGVDASDIAALQKAIEDDDYYFEDEALEKGITVPQLKEIRRIERENADLKRQMQEKQANENAEKLYAGWMNQAEETKKVYPTFDMRAEMANPKFVDLLRSNIDVRTAYEVLHMGEIIPAAMQFTAKTVESKIAKKIAANGARPAENGMSSGSAALVKSDVSKLNNKDIDEVMRRVARGERVTFG